MMTRRTHSYKRTHSSKRTHSGKRTHTSRTSKQKPNMMTRRTHLYTLTHTHEINTYLENVQAKAPQDYNGNRILPPQILDPARLQKRPFIEGKETYHRGKRDLASEHCHRRSSILSDVHKPFTYFYSCFQKVKKQTSTNLLHIFILVLIYLLILPPQILDPARRPQTCLPVLLQILIANYLYTKKL